MRATIDLPADLNDLAVTIAREKRQTLSRAVEEIMRRGLAS